MVGPPNYPVSARHNGYAGNPYVHADHHAVAFHPSNSNTLFLGTDNGIFKTTDGGNSWNDLHKVYKQCDILLFPAKFSNGNFTIIEAMA